MTSLELRRVEKRFGDARIVKPLDLAVEPGELVVLVGPSGCGKTTLLRMIAGLEPVTEGEIVIGGKAVTTLPPSERGVAMVFQNYALYPHMTVEENIAFGLKIAGVGKDERRQKARRVASILKLEPYLARKPKALSGGQRQRVAIGRAIIKQPSIFLFDEPLSNLDAELRVQTRLEIAKLHQELGATMIYVTHDQVEAMTLADRIVVLRDGQIEQVGRPIDLYLDPDNLFVAGFIGSPKMNFVPGRVDTPTNRGAILSAPALGPRQFETHALRAGAVPGQAVTLGFRPEHIVTAPNGAGFSAVTEIVEHLGSVSYGYVAADGGARIAIERRGQDGLRPGETVRLALDPEHLFAFAETGERL